MSFLKRVARAAIPPAAFLRRLPETPAPSVLLTFDDGPRAQVTPRVLDLLDRHGARALFFVVGRFLKRARGLTREIVDRGHVVGNHTYLHDNRRYVHAHPPLARYLADTRRCQLVVRDESRTVPRFFRPPGGRVTPVTLLVPRLLGMRCMGWSIECGDWRFRTDYEARAGATDLIERIAPRDVVLLHDDRPTAPALLERLLPELRERGFDLAHGLEALGEEPAKPRKRVLTFDPLPVPANDVPVKASPAPTRSGY